MSDYDAMPAGREMDAQVAERVLGWVREDWRDPVDGVQYSHKLLNRWGVGRAWVYGNPDNYSTDIAAAMAVWEHLRRSGRWCCLDIHSDYDLCWTVKLTAEQTALHTPAVIVDGEEDLPVAICRAALAAVAVQV